MLHEQDENTADKIGDGLKEGLSKFGGGKCKSYVLFLFRGVNVSYCILQSDLANWKMLERT